MPKSLQKQGLIDCLGTTQKAMQQTSEKFQKQILFTEFWLTKALITMLWGIGNWSKDACL